MTIDCEVVSQWGIYFNLIWSTHVLGAFLYFNQLASPQWIFFTSQVILCHTDCRPYFRIFLYIFIHLLVLWYCEEAVFRFHWTPSSLPYSSDLVALSPHCANFDVALKYPGSHFTSGGKVLIVPNIVAYMYRCETKTRTEVPFVAVIKNKKKAFRHTFFWFQSSQTTIHTWFLLFFSVCFVGIFYFIT